MSGRDTLFSMPLAYLGDWTFDEKVAAVFPDMVQRSIPGYRSILTLLGSLAAQKVRPNTHIYDLGCAWGAATTTILDNIPVNENHIIAVDNSAAMIMHCRQHLAAYLLGNSLNIIEGDIREISIENASIVVLNFTLQFLPMEDRQTLINKIYNGMISGGVLFLSEKFSFSDPIMNSLLFDLHHDFKRAKGYSDLEIHQKREMLENVMITDTVEMHKMRLQNAGFSSVELGFQCLNFGSLIALKK